VIQDSPDRALERPLDPVLDTGCPAPILGAVPLDDGRCRFTVWAPARDRVEVRLVETGRLAALEPAECGYHTAVVDDVRPGALYRLRLDGDRELPDPASRSQPEGVHGPSAVIDPEFAWTLDRFTNPPLAEHVFYELHVGTFSPEGTFAGAIAKLDDLVELGVTAVELMPISSFAGARGWGYDGVFPWAVHAPYGGLVGLQELVDAAHRRGLAVFLDVVHNHLGPEGNYLGEYAPYFTDRYRTPWGAAINFDGPESDEVRRLLIGSALHWIEVARIDGLRLDAIHAIHDRAPLAFLEELTTRVHQAAARRGRRVHVIAESNANDPRWVWPRERGGYGMDGQWNDDFHHALVALLTGERAGYYQSYGERSHLTRALRHGFVYNGEYSAFHRRRHGRAPAGVEPERLVVFAQNHDQIGNRMMGERLATRAGLAPARLAAALALLSPFVPLLFMGEEYAERAPFLYFTSHGDPELAGAVREGRRREFAAFRWQGEPPDPQAEDTFTASRLDWDLRAAEGHRQMLAWYRSLIDLRRRHPALAAAGGTDPGAIVVVEVDVPEAAGLLRLRRRRGGAEALVVANLDPEPRSQLLSPATGEPWQRVLDTGEPRFGGSGATAPERIAGTPGGITVGLPPNGVAVYSRGTS